MCMGGRSGFSSSCGMGASSCRVCGLSSCAVPPELPVGSQFPDQGLNPRSLHWKADT